MQDILASLTDISFSKFVTPKLMRYIYVLGILAAGVQSLIWLRMGMLGYILAPLSFLLSVVLIRMALEMALAVFQIAKYAGEIARRGRSPGEEVLPEKDGIASN